MGRQPEMAGLISAVDETLAGRGRLVMLVGEPGIGKTRMAQELAALAETQGAKVLWGWCYEEEGAPPYWPWLQCIRAYVQQTEPERLRSEMGSGAADISVIVTELRNKLPGLETPPASDPEEARFRLFDSVTNFLKTASQSQPLVLVIDDLHWADKPSLLLLQFLARELSVSGFGRLLVIGCYRDVELSRQHPLSETLANLSRITGGGGGGGFQRVLLRGLDQESTARFIEGTVGIEPAKELVEALYSHTEGNPFFMTEVIRLLSESQGLSAEPISTSDGLRIPESVREVIGQRLNRLSDECNEVLTTASAIGREFTLSQVNPLIDTLVEDRLVEVLEEALASRVIEELPNAMGSYRFTHALIRETLLDELSTTRRVRLHARIAETLEGLYLDADSDVSRHAAELAYFFVEAEPVLGHEKLVRYSNLAGERALAVYAWEAAEVHFQRALEAKQVSLTGLETATDAEAAELLFGLGRALGGVLPLYRIREAITTIARAFNYYADTMDVDRALVVVSYPIMGIGIGRRSGRAQMIERAMKLMPSDYKEEGRLLSDYGLALGIQEGEDDGAQIALNRALAIARQRGDAVLEMHTLCNFARVDRHQGRPQAALDKSLSAIELASHADNLAAEADAHHLAGNQLLEIGDPEAARYHGLRMSNPAKKLGETFSTLNALLINMRLAFLMGDWVAAREIGDRALVISSSDARLLLHRIMLEYEEGDFVQGTVFLDRLLEVMHITSPGPTLDTVYSAVAISLAARITGTGERLDLADLAAEAVLSSPYATHSVTVAATCARALVSVIREETDEAADCYTVLQSETGTILQDSMVALDRVLGLVARTIGNP
ncbi:MAG: AAA family ATPase, partial [Chloroflexi bacterium]|nr:AAA family ATPase [Chloroflexota bacterium]